MIKKKRQSTLRGYISQVCIIAMILTVFSIGVISYQFIKNNSIKQIRKVDSWLVKQQSQNVSYLIDKYNALALDLAFDNELQKALVDYNNQENAKKNTVGVTASNIFTEKYSYSSDFVNIVLFSLDGTVLGCKYPFNQYARMDQYPWYGDVAASMGKNLWFEPCTDATGSTTKNTLSIPMVRKIYSIQKRGNNYKYSTIALPQGYLLIYVNMDAFTALMNEDAVREFKMFLLVDREGQVIGSMNKSDVGQHFETGENPSGFVSFNNEKYLMTSDAISGSDGWNFIVLTNGAEVNREANQALIICIMICAILTVVLLVMTNFLSMRMNHPVNVLHTFFKKAETENVAIQEESRFLEFNDLYQSFNHMVDKIYTMSEEIHNQEMMQQELETESRESQIRALQMQINPHFLYNTLDCINWMAQMNNDMDVSEMILTLGKFFRSNIEMKGNFTSIGQELKNIELYMTLAKLRYRTRLHYFIEVDPSLNDLQIIKLLLQPLVENSMKYGLDQISGDEHIHLWIGAEDESVVVSLSDDGVGMSQEQLDNIRSLWENIGEYRADVRRVGLYNIMRRLYLCYKDDCSFEIFSEENNGTNVVITYPRMRYVPED